METVGGYRLVRKLGEGSRAVIHLGHAGLPDLSGHQCRPSGHPAQTLASTVDGPTDRNTRQRVAVIKVFRPTTSFDSIDREIDALAKTRSRHILRLQDVSTADDGRPCLVLPRLGSASLGRLLAVRHLLDAGETSTILIPLIGAVGLLHHSGVTHGAVQLDSVLFDEVGAPVLARFGKAAVVYHHALSGEPSGVAAPTAAQLDIDLGVAADRAGLCSIIFEVMERVDPRVQSRGLREVLAWLRDSSARPWLQNDFDHLVELLYEVAPAVPISFSVSSSAILPAPDFSAAILRAPERTVLAAKSGTIPGDDTDAVRSGEHPGHVHKRESLFGLFASFHLPDWLENVLNCSSDFHPLARMRTAVNKTLSPVRKPVWIAGGAGLGAIIVALAVIPPAPAASKGARMATPVTVHTVRAEYPPPSKDLTSGQGRPAVEQEPSNPDAAALLGKDPVSAATSLLTVRRTCLASRSLPCLLRVDQDGSAALMADSTLVRGLPGGTAIRPADALDGYGVSLVQQLGNTAILTLQPGALTNSSASNQNPVPLLLVRTGTGWRIRDLSFG